MAYQVRLGNFSGPFDLLCHLIENAELDICAISLAQVVDQYVAYVTLAQDHTDLDAVGEFLVLAARLLVLKTRVLLPPSYLMESEAEDLVLDTDTEQLVEHLQQYRMFRDLSHRIGDMIEQENLYIPTATIGCETAVPLPAAEPPPLELDSLVAAWIRLAPLFVRPRPVTIVPEHPTVDEEMTALSTRLRGWRSLSLKCYLGARPLRLRLVTVLLAVLELWRQGKVKVRQTARFGDIVVARKEEPKCKSNH